MPFTRAPPCTCGHHQRHHVNERGWCYGTPYWCKCKQFTLAPVVILSGGESSHAATATGVAPSVDAIGQESRPAAAGGATSSPKSKFESPAVQCPSQWTYCDDLHGGE